MQEPLFSPPDREWTVKAPKGRGLTVAELQEVLEVAPPGSIPTVLTRGFTGEIKQITVKGPRKSS